MPTWRRYSAGVAGQRLEANNMPRVRQRYTGFLLSLSHRVRSSARNLLSMGEHDRLTLRTLYLYGSTSTDQCNIPVGNGGVAGLRTNARLYDGRQHRLHEWVSQPLPRAHSWPREFR